MGKSRQIRRRNIVVDGIQYVYSVIEYIDDIQVRVYINKQPILKIHFSYPEAWAINVFRPKAAEILIRYFNKHYTWKHKPVELWLFQEKELFEIYLEYFFSDEDGALKERYLKNIAEYKHPKQNSLQENQAD